MRFGSCCVLALCNDCEEDFGGITGIVLLFCWREHQTRNHMKQLENRLTRRILQPAKWIPATWIGRVYRHENAPALTIGYWKLMGVMLLGMSWDLG